MIALNKLLMPAAFLLLVAIQACSSDDGPVQGEERGTCYPNGTCNTGLTCYSNVCVDPGNPEDTSTTPDSATQEDLSTGQDWNTGTDQTTQPDNPSCQPYCASGCGGDDGCGGTCGCQGSDQCVHGFCIPAGDHWLYGDVTITQIYDNVNNRNMGDFYDALNGTSFQFIMSFTITATNTVANPAEPPLFIDEFYTTVNWGSLVVLVRGSNLGPLADLPAQLQGAMGEFRLDSLSGGQLSLAGAVSSGGEQRIGIDSILFAGTVDGAGCPILDAFSSSSGVGHLTHFSGDGMTVLDLAEITGTFEYQ